MEVMRSEAGMEIINEYPWHDKALALGSQQTQLSLPPLKSERHLEKEILDLLLIVGQRKATTETELIQYAWSFSDVIIVWNGNYVTFMCGYVCKGYCSNRTSITLSAIMHPL